MATYQRLHWAGDDSGVSRRERAGCDFDAYIPDELAGRPWSLEGEVAADIADAEAEIVRFNTRGPSLSNTEGLARLLLRAEAVASSRIEGLEAGPRRVLRAEAAHNMGEASLDVGADEILGNIRAMQAALDAAMENSEVSLSSLLRIHRELMRGTRHEHFGGQVRTEQNWIGGNSYNPCTAAFVPPPADRLPQLLQDLCDFCSGDDLSPLAQAGIAHAQFETIHPFADGNGRTGRALIHLILKRRGVAATFVPPISLVLATWSERYVAGLTAYRYVGNPVESAAAAGVNEWLTTFAAATRRALADAAAYEGRIEALTSRWRTVLGRIRDGSSLDLLVRALPGAPILSVRTAQHLTGRSFEATNQAVARLVDARILSPIKVGRRNRAFEAPELIEAFVTLERGLASAEGDTRVSPPSRPVPRRPDGRAYSSFSDNLEYGT